MAEKDTYLKLLSQTLSGGAMDALSVEGVELGEHLPTELPASAMRIDMVWRMSDGRLFHLEFQNAQEPALYRFLEYDTRLIARYQTRVRTVVLYHAAVARAVSELDGGTVQFQVENVYLVNQNGDAALDVVEQHLEAAAWEPADRLRLALALNMAVRDRTQAFERMLALVPRVPEPQEGDLITAAIMALADATLTDNERARLRKELRKMSKMAEELYRDGKLEGKIEGKLEGKIEGKLEGKIEGKLEGKIETAKAMLAGGERVETIVKYTALTRQQVEALKTALDEPTEAGTTAKGAQKDVQDGGGTLSGRQAGRQAGR